MKTRAVALVFLTLGCRDKDPAADTAPAAVVEAPDPCAELPALPVDFHTWTGFTGPRTSPSTPRAGS